MLGGAGRPIKPAQAGVSVCATSRDKARQGRYPVDPLPAVFGGAPELCVDAVHHGAPEARLGWSDHGPADEAGVRRSWRRPTGGPRRA